MLVTDADSKRYRRHTAAQSRPKSVEKLFGTVQEDDHLVATRCTGGLQEIKYPERTVMQVLEGNMPLQVFSLDVGDAVVDAAIALEYVDQRGFGSELIHIDHLECTLIMRFDRGRRLICASNSMGSSSARVSRKRRVMVRKCTSISNIARFSPMQCRGPTANGM